MTRGSGTVPPDPGGAGTRRARVVRNSGITIAMVRVVNFRCLRAVEVPLGRTPVLIGENNVGKTSLLEALHAAIGSGLRHFSEEDVMAKHHRETAPEGPLDHCGCPHQASR